VRDPRPLTAVAAATLLVAITGVAFGNSFAGLFVMDDISEIRLNEALATLLPPWRAMFVGRVVPARPLPYLSFAVDRALWGPADPFGYHLTNLAIHCCAAVLLFGLVRRTLLSPRLRERFAPRATGLALAVAAVWAVHPLQTQAVTYVYQRIESLCGLFVLAAAYSFARAAAAAWSPRWLACCVAAAAAAMASKEHAVVIPLLVAAWDRTYCDDGVAGMRRRLPFYAALCATWLVLAAVVASQAGKYGEFKAAGPGPVAYALTQPRVILHYLRLAIVPAPLCFDYSWRTLATAGEILPSACYVGALLVATLVGLWRRRAWAWPAVAFFLLLAPTSSVLPVAALVAEHRMYLPLAAVVALLIVGGDALVAAIAARYPRLGRATSGAALIAVAAWTAALVGMTRARNEIYATPGGVWLDVIARQRHNTRELWNLAAVSLEYAGVEPALRFADETTGLNPRLPVYRDLVEQARAAGDGEAAERILRHGLERSRAVLGAEYPVVRGLAALAAEQARAAPPP
jgi:hypothetical protein